MNPESIAPDLHEKRERVFLILAGIFLGTLAMLNILGITRFAIRIRDTETGEDVSDAKVSILASPSEKGEAQYSLALNSPADRTYYLAQLDMETSGIWAVEVIAESDLGAGTTVMSVQVSDRGRSGTGNDWGQALFGLVTLSFVVGIGWVWYQSKQALKRRDQQQ